MSPFKLVGLGMLLVILGVLGPLLMVLELVATTYWLSFLSYGASIGGLLLGLMGSAFYVRERTRDDDDYNYN